MSKITVTYQLDQNGQRASLLAGGNGCHEQVLEVPEDHPLREDVIWLGQINGEGNVTLAVPNPDQFTHVGVEMRETREDYRGMEILTYSEKTVSAPWPADYQHDQHDHHVGWSEPRTLEDLVPLVRDLENGRASSLAAVKAEKAAAEAAAEAGNELAYAAGRAARHEEMEARKRRLAEKAEAKKARTEAALAAAIYWAREHGSERLQAIVAENLLKTSMAVYRDERLAAELPDWIWDASWADGEVEHRDPRNPQIGALELLTQARKELPDGCEGKLIWAHYGDGDVDCGYYEDGDAVDPIREYVVLSEFLGRRIIRRC